MKNKGFTLIELLGVIIILSLLVIIIFPSIIGSVKNSGEKTDELMLDMIYNAADLYISSNPNEYWKEEGNKYIVSLDSLVAEGLLASPIKFSDSDEDITNLKCIEAEYSNGQFSYVLKNKGECVFTGTIYRNTEDIVGIGDSIEPSTKTVWCGVISGSNTSCTAANLWWDTEPNCVSGMAAEGVNNATCIESEVDVGLTPGSYYTETTKSSISQDYYLKHLIVNDIVQESYACMRYTINNKPKEACLRGGSSSFYGTFDGMTAGMSTVNSVTDPTENIKVIDSVRNYCLDNSGSCGYSDSSSHCNIASKIYFNAQSNGLVVSRDNISLLRCLVLQTGAAYCEQN